MYRVVEIESCEGGAEYLYLTRSGNWTADPNSPDIKLFSSPVAAFTVVEVLPVSTSGKPNLNAGYYVEAVKEQ